MPTIQEIVARQEEEDRIKRIQAQLNPARNLDEQKAKIGLMKSKANQLADAKGKSQRVTGTGLVGSLAAMGINAFRKKDDPEQYRAGYLKQLRDADVLNLEAQDRKAQITAGSQVRGQDFEIDQALTKEQNLDDRQNAGFRNTEERYDIKRIDDLDDAAMEGLREDASLGEVQEFFTDTGTSVQTQKRGDGTIVDATTKKPISINALTQRYPEDAIKARKARESMGGQLAELGNYFMAQFNEGAGISITQSGPENILNYARASVPMFDQAAGTRAGQIFSKIDAVRPTIINEIRQASEMGVRGMDTKAEMDFYLQAMGATNRDVGANMGALIMLNNAYGLGNLTGIENIGQFKKDIAKLEAEWTALEAANKRGAEKPDEQEWNETKQSRMEILQEKRRREREGK
jgi:hypothetical protein|tara:strand:+ start:327 stop:1538 length:1212 start_codon:yes stop_codon:yes gene_type:complete